MTGLDVKPWPAWLTRYTSATCTRMVYVKVTLYFTRQSLPTLQSITEAACVPAFWPLVAAAQGLGVESPRLADTQKNKDSAAMSDWWQAIWRVIDLRRP